MIDLERLERLAEAATPGSWTTDDAHVWVAGEDGRPHTPLFIPQLTYRRWGRELSTNDHNANARFIAAAREAIPALIAAVRERDARVTALEAELAAEKAKVTKLAKLEAAISWIEPPFVDGNTPVEELRTRIKVCVDDARRARRIYEETSK